MRSPTLLLVSLSIVACARVSNRADDAFLDALAQTNAKVEQFQYSPDGRRIAYLSAKNGSHHVWVMGSNGTDARPVNPRNPVHQVSDGASVRPRP